MSARVSELNSVSTANMAQTLLHIQLRTTFIRFSIVKSAVVWPSNAHSQLMTQTVRTNIS